MTAKSTIRLISICFAVVVCTTTAYRLYVVVAPDTFESRLSELAGPEAECLGHYSGWSAELEMKMADAYRKKQPFWVLSDREYRNIHDLDDTWSVSEGFVLTPDGRLFQIDRYRPTLFRDEKSVGYEIPSPNIYTREDDSYYIGMYGKSPVEF